jgi:heptosyltransferase-2
MVVHKDTQKILVKGTNWVGDTILAFPAVHSLRTLFPNAHIYVLASSHLAELWMANSDIDEVIPYDMSKNFRRIFAEMKIARFLRRRSIDLAIILPRSFSSALMVFCGGIPYRIGYAGEARDWLLTEKVRRSPELLRQHRMNYYLQLINILGNSVPPPLPQLSINGEVQGWARRFLKRKGLQDKLFVGFNPGASYGEAKCWFPERFVELGRRLIKENGAFIFIFGSSNPKERVLNATIAQGIGEGCLNLTGETTLLQLASLLQLCCLIVTNDTGTMHIGAAVGTRVVAIFGSTDPRTTSPLGEGHVVVRKEVPCSPCFKRVCTKEHQCMDLITMEEVYSVVEAQLKEKLP